MPPPRLLLAIPVLPVLSIPETLAFYEGKLGFNRAIDSEDYAGVERDGLQIHFWLTGDPALPRASSCRLNVTGVDAFFDGEGDAPAEKPWGFRELTVVDPSGNTIILAEEIPGWVEE